MTAHLTAPAAPTAHTVPAAHTVPTASAPTTEPLSSAAVTGALRRALARGHMAEAASTLDLLGGDADTRLHRRLRFADTLAERGFGADALNIWRDCASDLITRQQPQRAAALCRRVLRRAPGTPDWSLRLARLYVSAGALGRARRVLEAARDQAHGFDATLIDGMLRRIRQRQLTGPLSKVA